MHRNTSATHPRQPSAARRLVLLVILLAFLYAVLPRLASFRASLEVLDDARWALVLAAVGCVVVTYLLAAFMYLLLARRRLRYGPTLVVQIASGFTNRLLPAGIGGLTLMVGYLRRQRHSLPQALAIAGVNNTLGLVGHLLLLLAVALSGASVRPNHMLALHTTVVEYVVLGILLVVLVNVLVFRRLRHYLYELTAEVIEQFVSYARHPQRLVAALGCSAALTLAYVAVLFLCAAALGSHLHFFPILVIFTAGVAAATVTPTPGGLLGAEAGLVAGLMAYNESAAQALAIALLYRLLSYWLPIVPGFISFSLVRKKYL